MSDSLQEKHDIFLSYLCTESRSQGRCGDGWLSSPYFLWHGSAWFSTANVTSAGWACIVYDLDKRDIMRYQIACQIEEGEAQRERVAYSSDL